jgi:hypothetical protein
MTRKMSRDKVSSFVRVSAGTKSGVVDTDTG